MTVDRNTQVYLTTTEPPRPQLPTFQQTSHTGEHDFLNINSFWKHEIYIPKDPVCNVNAKLINKIFNNIRKNVLLINN